MCYFELLYLLGILLFTLTFPGIFILKTLPDFEDKKMLYPLIPLISMSFNGLFYWILYLTGTYYRITILASWAIYGLFFFVFSKKPETITKNSLKLPGNSGIYKKKYSKLGIVVSVFIILFFVYYALLSLTTLFTSWDAIAHWNRWPVQMAESNFVGNEYFYGFYPQLMPSIFSVIYKMNFFDQNMFLNLGQYMNHFYVLLFTILICWILYRYSQLKNLNPLVSILMLLSNIIYIYWIIIGYCDLFPGVFIIGFFYLTDIYNTKRKYFDNAKKPYLVMLFLLSLFASAAAFAKQPAALLLVFFIFLSLYELIRKRTSAWKLIIIVSLPILLMSTFYVRGVVKYRGVIRNNITYLEGLNSIHAYKNVYLQYMGDKNSQLEKINFGTKVKLRFHQYCAGFISSSSDIYKSKKSTPLFLIKIFIILSLFYGIFKREERMKIFFLLSLFFIWIRFFGYDIRHMLMIFPLMALIGSLFINKLFNQTNLKKYIISVVLLGLLVVFVINNVSFILQEESWRKINLHIFTKDREERFQAGFPVEADLLNIMKQYEFYTPGNEAYAHLIGFYPYHPDAYYVGFDHSYDRPPSGMKIGDFFFTIYAPEVMKKFKELVYIGTARNWYGYRKICPVEN